MKPLKDYVWFRKEMERSGMKGRDGAMNITERERTEKRRRQRRPGAWPPARGLIPCHGPGPLGKGGATVLKVGEQKF